MRSRGLVALFRSAALTAGILGAASAAAAGTLKVTSFPSGAQVIVDGVHTGKVTPMNVSLTDGDHVVTVEIPGSGWNPDTRVVTIVPGNNDLSVTLLPAITQGPEGPPGPRGAPGAPATLRAATNLECPTGGIVVTSGDGVVSLPVCNGLQGAKGEQGQQGLAGPPGPSGPPGGAPVVDPTTLVGFAHNLKVTFGSRAGDFGISPIYLEIETLQETLGSGQSRYLPGKLRLAPFAIAAQRSEEVAALEEWVEDVRTGDISSARRNVVVELYDQTMRDLELSIVLTDCLPSTFGSAANVTALMSAVIQCDSNDVSVSSVRGGIGVLHTPGVSPTMALSVNGTRQGISGLTGGAEYPVGLLVEGQRPEIRIDPLRMRAGTLADSVFSPTGLVAWIVASLTRDSNGQFRDVALQVRKPDGTWDPVAQYSDVFLTAIGLLDPGRAFGSTTQVIPVGFDLVMQANGRQ